jgi:hypothetical protein
LLSLYFFHALVRKKITCANVWCQNFLTSNVNQYAGVLNCWDPRLYCSRSSAKEGIWNGMWLVRMFMHFFLCVFSFKNWCLIVLF